MAAPPPVANYRVPLVGADVAARAWQTASQNQVWTGRRPAAAGPFEILERIDAGIARLPARERFFHVIPAGRPHRVGHAFGFWRTCGADVVFVQSPYDGGFAATMIVSTVPAAYVADVLGWTCGACARPLHEVEIPTRRVRLDGLIERAQAAVRAFNADEAARTCPSCAAVHPPAYGFEPALDDDTEAAARNVW